MCKIEGCRAKPVALGLCARHYMRERRTGDPNKVGQPGRKRSAARTRLLAEGYSPRSVTRLFAAVAMLPDDTMKLFIAEESLARSL
jgi:hypothetical protein